MRFFDFFRKLTGTDEDSRLKKLSNRISELFRERTDIEERQKKTNSSADTSWFKITPTDQVSVKTKDFTPPQFGKIRTMADLLEKREKKEQERGHHIRGVLTELFTKTIEQIKLENADKAEEYLYKASPLEKELKEDSFTEHFKSLQADIKELKAILLQKEIERREEEERKLAEERARKEKLEAERQERIREQQLEKEREAHEYEEELARIETERAEENARLRSTVTQKKTNPDAFLNHLRLNGVRYFYHFTDEMNVNSIKRLGGLYSWYYCSQHDIKIPNAGGDLQSRGLDSRYGLQDYVRLSFCPDHPMAYRKYKEGARLVLLKIKIDVATFKDTLFSDMNAADSDHTHGGNLSDLQRVNIGATKASYVSRNSPIFHAHQAECMVKTFIPIEYIENINNPDRMVF